MAKPQRLDLSDYHGVVEDYHKESDRASVVLAGSFVEHYLAAYLKHFMIDDASIGPLFAGFGPFATFEQRISVAYAFSLIPKDLGSKVLDVAPLAWP